MGIFFFVNGILGIFAGRTAARGTSVAAFVFAILSACFSGGLVIAMICWAIYWRPGSWSGFTMSFQDTNFALALVLLFAGLAHGMLQD